MYIPLCRLQLLIVSSRICNLLATWIHDYPHDFSVKGTAGALSAFVTSVINKSYLLHYGSDFLPFLEELPGFVDTDFVWATKEEYGLGDESSDEDEDDGYSFLEKPPVSSILTSDPDEQPKEPGSSVKSLPEKQPQNNQRERKGSLPLTNIPKVMQPAPGPPPLTTGVGGAAPGMTVKEQVKHLQRVAAEVYLFDSEDIAKEITRIEEKLFTDISVGSSILLLWYID